MAPGASGPGRPEEEFVAYFYVSYAHGDDDSYVSKFRHDLAAAVDALTHEPGPRAGAGPPGEKLVGSDDDPVANCRVFVALCTTRYFLSERCGREWASFTRRLDRYEKATGARPAALIPVIWSATQLVEEAADIQGWRPSLTTDPDGEEMSRLIRLGSRRNEYRAVIAALAQRIVTVADSYDIPPAGPDENSASVTNAFANLPPRFADAAAQFVHLVVAAATREEMRDVRADLQFYGASGEDWAPYRPSVSAPLANRARTLLAERLYAMDVSDLGGLADRIDRARSNNDIVVLLVDAWITRLTRYERMLTAFDRSGPGAAVLVPANRDDAESAGQRRELNSSVSRTFQHSVARRDLMFRSAIETAVGFDTDLVTALEEAKNRIFQKGQVFRHPPDTSSGARPILEGP
jgi:FxsC-like protein